MKNYSIQKWLTTSSQVLHEPPEHLQKLVLKISSKNPDMGFYASELASLRMSGLKMNDTLNQIWQADSANGLEEIIAHQSPDGQSLCHALPFLIDLKKIDLDNGSNRQQAEPVMH